MSKSLSIEYNQENERVQIRSQNLLNAKKKPNKTSSSSDKINLLSGDDDEHTNNSSSSISDLESNKKYFEYKINSIKELEPGDHAVVCFGEKIYFHFILDSVDLFESSLNIIFYANDLFNTASAQKREASEEDEEEKRMLLVIQKSFALVDNFSVASSQNLNETKSNDENVLDLFKPGVRRIKLYVDLSRFEVYKIVYEPNGANLLSVEKTLEKARKLVGQLKYNVFENNDEHFAIYCKTGKAGKLFIIDPKSLAQTGNAIGKNVSEKIVTNLAAQSGQIILVNTAKHIVTKFPARATLGATLPVAAEAAGSMIGVGIESVSMSIDIYQKHKKLREGKISEMKFKKYIAKRVSRGTMSVAGGIGGGLIGQIVIPVPVLGVVVGGVIGGIVGAAAGHGQGILIGELVQFIDNKRKEKQQQQQQTNEKKSNSDLNGELSEENETLSHDQSTFETKSLNDIIINEIETKNDNNSNNISNSDSNLVVNNSSAKFSVIDKLVFKYDKNILKPENFAHLNPNKLSNPTNRIINDANKLINDEDYEIYLLEDTNEIVNKLDYFNNSLNSDNNDDNNNNNETTNTKHLSQQEINSLKRISIEEFNEKDLPTDLNVYFKLD